MISLHNFVFTTFYTTLIFIFFSFNPLLMGFWIIIQALVTAMILSMIFIFSWFSYILFIVYLGGILMLFSYIISMIPQLTIFPLKNKINFLFFIFLVLNVFLLKKSEILIFDMNILEKVPNVNLFFCFSSFLKTSVFLFIYLLFILIAVVFLIENSKGSIRSN